MTTQRDRLAAVLLQADIDRWGESGGERTPDEFLGWADALLARGVRVVDAETLAAALRVFIWDQFDGDVDEGDRRQAEEFLAVLDGESRTENGTEATPDAEDDDGPVRWIWNIPREEADL